MNVAVLLGMGTAWSFNVRFPLVRTGRSVCKYGMHQFEGWVCAAFLRKKGLAYNVSFRLRVFSSQFGDGDSRRDEIRARAKFPGDATRACISSESPNLETTRSLLWSTIFLSFK